MVQADIAWEDPATNLAHYEAFVRRLVGTTDLAVLPELFTTGSIRSPKPAGPMDGETVASLKTWAAACGIALTGSFLATENGKYYNRSFFITPEGDAFYADKRHLFRMGGEDRRLEAGTKRLIVSYREWNICILVCYDLRFPVWSRNVGNAYDLLVYSANWPASRKSVWQTLLPARAIENLAWVCGVNRTGVDGTGLAYHGHSVVYSPLGELSADAGQAMEILCSCTLSKAALESVRAEFPVWKDADSFTLQGIER